MPIIVDGVTIQDCSGVDCDNINMVGVDADNTRVYTEQCADPAGSVTVDYGSASGDTQYLTNNGNGSWTFRVPLGKTSVTVCMVGGGGTGSSHNQSTQYGGFAGNEISQSYSVTPESNVALQVGLGGQSDDELIQGDAGRPSTFGGLTASGGAGGTPIAGYQGNGGAGPSGCGGGGYHDGTLAYEFIEAYGGQASSFGDGGDGAQEAGATAPGIGGGSGGVFSTDHEDLNGGNGRVILTWS